MAFCTRCGRQIEEGAICSCYPGAAGQQQAVRLDTSSASNFVVSMKNRMGIGTPERNATDCYERGQRIVPDSIVKNESEIPIRQYDVAVLRSRLKFERAEGRMQVTNKRVLFRATGRSLMGRTNLQYEFAIAEIAGLEIRQNYRFSFLNFLLGNLLASYICLYPGRWLIRGAYNQVPAFGVVLAFVLAIACACPFFLMYKRFWPKLMLLGFGTGCMTELFLQTRENKFIGVCALLMIALTLIDYILVIIVPNLVLTIKNKGDAPPVDIRRRKWPGLLGWLIGSLNDKAEYTGFDEVLPTPQTESAVREMGAMISDIQSYGDLGVEKWMQ